MRIINRLTNANVGETSLGRYERTLVGAAIAHIPNFEAYYDAEYYTQNAKEILNMAKGTMTELPNAFTSITDENGHKAVERVYVNTSNSVTHVGDFDINPNNFTFFVVLDHYFDETNSNFRHFRLIRKTISDALPSVHITVDNAGPNVRFRKTSESENNTAVSAVLGSIAQPSPKPSLLIFSYSDGVAKIRVNGVETTGEMSPPETGLLAGEWDWFRNLNGKVYAWGGFNIDLAALENRGYLEQLENYYKTKYSIA